MKCAPRYSKPAPNDYLHRWPNDRSGRGDGRLRRGSLRELLAGVNPGIRKESPTVLAPLRLARK